MQKMKGAVGMAVKGGAKPPNTADDVQLVRGLLRANGFMVAAGGGIGPDIYKGIQKAAKKAGIEMPAALIEPNSPLMKYLKPKYERALKGGEAEPAKGKGGGKTVEVWEVNVPGKGKVKLDKKGLAAGTEAIFKSLDRYITTLIRNHSDNMKTVKQYDEAAQARNGLIRATVHVTSAKLGGAQRPNVLLGEKLTKATSDLARAQANRDLKGLQKSLPIVERLYNLFSAELQAFTANFSKGAGRGATSCAVTSAVGFAVVGAMAAPLMVGALGVEAAAAASAGGVAAVKSASTDLGRAASGEKVTVFEFASNMTIDSAVGVLTAGIGNKIPVKWIDKMSKGLAPAIAKKIPGMSPATVAPFVRNFITGTGEETVKGVMGEALGLLGKRAKSGKTLDMADFDEAAKNLLVTALTAGLVKNLTAYEKSGLIKMRHEMEVKLLPDAISSVLGKANKLSKKDQVKVLSEMAGKVYEEMLKAGTSAVIPNAKGNEAPDKLATAAAAAAAKDARIKKLILKETEAALKRLKLDQSAPSRRGAKD